MTNKKSSLAGRLALVHFLLTILAGGLYLAFFPVRPASTPRHEILISQAAGSVLSILMFPQSQLVRLIPRDSDLQPLSIVLLPLNSCLWGYLLVWLYRSMRKLSQRSQPSE